MLEHSRGCVKPIIATLAVVALYLPDFVGHLQSCLLVYLAYTGDNGPNKL